MIWERSKILNINNEIVEAQAPIIISASRATDIPAFYGNNFIESLKKGYTIWKNPFNGKEIYVSFQNTRVFVFWTKNPKSLIPYLDFLNEKNYNYYFQFTLNDYDKTLEKYIPPLQDRIETFIELSQKIGKEKVIWRFDPYILTKEIGVEELLNKTENIASEISNYTEKLVFSFADISSYNKVKRNMRNIDYREFSECEMFEIAEGLQKIGKSYNIEISSCSEEIELEKFGISHNKCIDDKLLLKLFPEDKLLSDFLLQNKNLKDKGQRKNCGCIASKDIGTYNTCTHGCVYCYANSSLKI